MALKVKELPLSERPYEKLEMYGEASLSNAELLAIIIKTGTKEDSSINLAQRILKLNETNDNNNLRFLDEISLKELKDIKGIGRVKGITLKAVAEIAKRMSRPINTEGIIINNTADIANLLMEELRYEKREIVKLVMLNSKNVVIRILDISYGGTNFSTLAPKEILTEAIKLGVPRIILVHNHPSGNSNPSEGDKRVTERIWEARKCASE